LHTEAHISEILDSDNEIHHEISSEDDKPPKNIWNNADFWGNPSRKPLEITTKSETNQKLAVKNSTVLAIAPEKEL